MIKTLLLLLSFSFLQAPSTEIPQLGLNEKISGQITGQDRIIETDLLAKTLASNTPARGDRYHFIPPESGLYFLRIRSASVRPHVVLRKPTGEVIAEDRSGLLFLFPRVVVYLDAGNRYLIDVASPFGLEGTYEVSVEKGRPETTLDDFRKDALKNAQDWLQIPGKNHDVAHEQIARLLAPTRPEEAIEHAQNAVNLRTERLGAAHPASAESLRALASILLAQGKSEPARRHLQQAISLDEETFGPGHPVLAEDMGLIARCYQSEQNFKRAQHFFQSAIDINKEALGHEHPGTGLWILELGWLSKLQGNLAKARDLIEEGTRILENTLGPAHPDTAFALNDLGLVRKEQKDYQAARTAFERALKIRREVLPPHHPQIAVTLANLAFVLRDLGDSKKACEMLEDLADLQEKTLGPDHTTLASTLHSYGILLYQSGDYDAAHRMHARALKIREEKLGPEDLDTAMSSLQLGWVLGLMGKSEQARPLVERAITIRKKALGSDHPATAHALNDLGMIHMERYDYPAAASAFARALRIREKVLPPLDMKTATTLFNLAFVSEELGQSSEARWLAEKALRIQEEVLGPLNYTTTRTLALLSRTFKSLGNYAKARSVSERVLSIREKMYGPNHAKLTVPLSSLADINWILGKNEEALPLIERAITIYEATAEEDTPGFASCLNQLSIILLEVGQIAEARAPLERALAMYRRLDGDRYYRTAGALNNMGALLLKEGEYEAAYQYFPKAYQIWEETLGPDHPITEESRTRVAMIFADQGKPEEAWNLVTQSLESVHSTLDQMLHSLTESERIHAAKRSLSTIGMRLSIVHQMGTQEAIDQAYQSILDWKGQIYRSLARGSVSFAAPLTERTEALHAELKGVRSLLSNAIYSEGQDGGSTHQVHLKELREQRTRLELELRRELGPSASKPSATPAEVRSALPKSSALIDFFIHPLHVPAPRDKDGRITGAGHFTEHHLVAWILKSDGGNLIRVDLGPSGSIESVVSNFLEGLVKHRGLAIPKSTSIGEGSKDIRELFWVPLEKHLKNIETVLVSPDEFLGSLPFEVIQKVDGSFLIEHHAFVYLQDAASLVDMGTKRSDNIDRGLLCVGNVDYRRPGDLSWRKKTEGGDNLVTKLRSLPDYSRGFSDRWYRLPWTLSECAAVTDLHDEVFGESAGQLWLNGREATEERVKAELPSYRVAHIATHGFFQPEGLPSMWEQVKDTGSTDGFRMQMRPEERLLTGMLPGLLSGLVLAGANKAPDEGREDGFLTAEELSFLDLTNLDLVVLSACETALGRAEAGEGMLGLRRTLRQAGVKTVIGSLWSVQDESTSELMQDFYRRLWIEKKTKLQSLREAQLAMLKKNRIENDGQGLPSTWGAFVLDGEW